MKLTKVEQIVILITASLLCVALGYFICLSTTQNAVVVEAAAPEPSGAVVSETPDLSMVETIEEAVPKPETAEAVSVDEEGNGLMDLNTASVLELETLPNIGPVLAQRIVDYREEHGGFSSVEELKNIEGIGDKKYESIQNLVEVVTE